MAMAPRRAEALLVSIAACLHGSTEEWNKAGAALSAAVASKAPAQLTKVAVPKPKWAAPHAQICCSSASCRACEAV